MNFRFVWDKDKALSNLSKHGVSFDEASTVFHDELSITISDIEHSIGEIRYVHIGSFNKRQITRCLLC